MLPTDLEPHAIRVLASLVEKALSTPDHYPLSLNALTNACNQSSNRDPVMSLDEEMVARTLDGLRRRGLVRSFQGIGSRVPKYQHLLEEAGELSVPEQAVWSVLALRGPQTMAEIRSRATRLLPGDNGDGAEAAVEALIARAPSPVVTRLPRRPGQKEVRYAHLMGGEVVFEAVDAPEPTAGPGGTGFVERITSLEALVQELRDEVADVRAQLESFRKQFE